MREPENCCGDDRHIHQLIFVSAGWLCLSCLYVRIVLAQHNNMTEYTLIHLKKIHRELSIIVKQVPEMYAKFVSFATQYLELVSNVSSEHVPHYVNDFF